MQRFRRGGSRCQGAPCVSTSWMCGPDSDKSLGAGPSRGCHRCPTPLVARHLTRQVQRLRPQYSTRWNLNGAQAAHVAAGNSGLSRSDLKAPSAQIDLQFGQLHLSSLHVTLNLATIPAGDYQMILLDRPRALSKSNSIGDVQSSKVNVSELSDDPSGFQRCWVRAPSLYFPICCPYKILSEKLDEVVSRWVCAGRTTYITLKWIKERCRSCGEISTKAIRFV